MTNETPGLPLELWISNIIRMTEPDQLRWVIPLRKDPERKRNRIMMIMGITAFVEKELQRILQESPHGTEAAFALAQHQEIPDQNALAVEMTDFIKAARGTPHDVDGSLILATLFANRTKARRLLEEIQILKNDDHFSTPLARTFRIEPIIEMINTHLDMSAVFGPNQNAQAGLAIARALRKERPNDLN